MTQVVRRGAILDSAPIEIEIGERPADATSCTACVVTRGESTRVT